MAKNDEEAEHANVDLSEKAKRWLDAQGYPIEFKVANTCRKYGFRTWQGFHVRDEQSKLPREIDVVASVDHFPRSRLIRMEHVIECKWSKDKPWIVFTSPSASMAPSACTAQTIGDLLGSAAVWTIAGNSEAHSLDYFCTPERPGFGGRQAFSKGQDLFYSALAAVADLSFLLAKRHERLTGPLYSIPESAHLVFPVVVVDGLLFEAYFDEEENDIQLARRDRIRCHWRGASSWNLNTTIDIVTLDHFDEFISVRAREAEMLLSQMKDAVDNIELCFKKQSLAPLKVYSGPRGVLGLPRLLEDLHLLDEMKRLNRKSNKKPESQK